MNQDNESWECSGQDWDTTEHERQGHRARAQAVEGQKERIEELKINDEEQCRKLFGLGSVFGRRRRLKEIREAKETLKSLRFYYEGQIENTYSFMEEFRESAEKRQLLLRCGLINIEQAQSAEDSEIDNKISELVRIIDSKHEYANEIEKYFRSGKLTLEQVKSPEIDQRIAEIHQEEKLIKSRKYDDKEPLEFHHMAFVRRTEYLPEIDPETGRLCLLTPFSAIDDPKNPHFARISSHWSINSYAENPALYGHYGTSFVFVCEGEKMVEANGLPHCIQYNDTYWLHDIELPKGTKMFVQQGKLNPEQLTSLKNFGLEIIEVEDGQKLQETVNGDIERSGYSGYELSKGFRELADRYRIIWGDGKVHFDDPVDAATRMVNYLLSKIKSTEEISDSKALNEIIETYEEILQEISSTESENPGASIQVEKIKKLLGPVIDEIRKRIILGSIN